jgi:glutamate dehydrogenase (NAD(P)+)
MIDDVSLLKGTVPQGRGESNQTHRGLAHLRAWRSRMNATGLISPRHTSPDNFADAGMDPLLELEAAARVLDLEDWIVERLRHPECEETRALLVRRDNGQAMTVPLLHVEHSTVKGITCGRLALGSDCSLPGLRSEAMHGSWQHAVLGLPFGGSATSLICDPRNLSERELQRTADEYRKLSHVREHVTYRGAGINECIAGWMSGASDCFVSGIPEPAGGMAQDRISALAICEVIRHWCMRRGERLTGQRVAIQGFDRVGIELANVLYHSGALLVAVADVSGGVADSLGLNSDALTTQVQREGVLIEYSDAEIVSNSDVLQAPCDVLVLADSAAKMSETITDRVHARLVVEFAPDVLTASAERVLAAREIEVVPALLASAGAALAAYIEYAQRDTIRWSKSCTNAFVRRVIRQASDEIGMCGAEWNVTARHAAIALGVERVAGQSAQRDFEG